MSGKEIWQFIQLLILPNIHLVFYYNIHNSHGGRKVKLLTAFTISPLPVTRFSNVKLLFLLLPVRGTTGAQTTKTALRACATGLTDLWAFLCSSQLTHTNRKIHKLKPKDCRCSTVLAHFASAQVEAICSGKGKYKLQTVLRARQTKPHSVDTFLFYCALSCIRLLKQTQNILGLMRPKYAFGMLCGQLQNFTTIYSMCLKYWPPIKYHHFLLLPLSAGIAKGYLYKKNSLLCVTE